MADYYNHASLTCRLEGSSFHS